VSATVEVEPLGPVRAAVLLVQRNYIVYRQAWKLFLTGFFEPFFYLLSIGIGVGQLIDTFEFNGQQIPYAEFVAPGMLAASALNGALIDATFNTFFKLKFIKLYDQMLATPLSTRDVARGEIAWSQLRGSAYAAAFLVVMTAMGLVHSWWAVLAFPATILIGFMSSAVCMAATTYMKSWQDFEKVTLVQLPLFLFSGTFFPISAFPAPVQWIVECTPLYRGVVLCRELTTGALSWGSLVSVVYLVALGLAGLAVVRRRLDALLLT
jgi:lipooligosaccharide transport system permease protein